MEWQWQDECMYRVVPGGDKDHRRSIDRYDKLVNV